MARGTDRYEGPDPREVDELNRTADDYVPLQQRRWWHWVIVAIAIIVIAALVFPTLASVGLLPS
ncbi:MAG: hypothetical protein FJ318_03000 [SAR202 cluster bacterium]|nr:hypothetical protein [SAR202 cluster bacterium]